MNSILKCIKEKNKDITIVLLLLIILLMYSYYTFFEINTSLKLHQRIGLWGVEYEQVYDMYIKEHQNNFTKEDFEKYKEIIEIKSPNSPSKIQQYVVFNYERQNKKIIIEVTPGLKNMRIIDIEIVE